MKTKTTAMWGALIQSGVDVWAKEKNPTHPSKIPVETKITDLKDFRLYSFI